MSVLGKKKLGKSLRSCEFSFGQQQGMARDDGEGGIKG
jgi:hypothetical protein